MDGRLDLCGARVQRRKPQDRAVDHRGGKEEVAQRGVGHFGNPRPAVLAQVDIAFPGQPSQHFPQGRSREAEFRAETGFVKVGARLHFQRQDRGLERLVCGVFWADAVRIGHGCPLDLSDA